MLLLALVAFLVLAIVAFMLFEFATGSQQPAAAPANPPAPSAGATTRSASPTPGGSSRPETAVVEVVPGLWRGTATMTSNSDTLHGIPLGWSRNTDGAISAAFASETLMFSKPNFVESTRPELVARMFTPEAQNEVATTAKQAANIRRSYRLNDQGQVLNAKTMKVSDTERFVGTAMPRYGAYQVDHVGYGPDQMPNEARIKTWTPVTVGIADGTDQSGVALNWQQTLVTLRWWDNDWRTDRTEVLSKIVPAQRNMSNQPFAERRAALGPGWVVLADATAEVYPGAERTR